MQLRQTMNTSSKHEDPSKPRVVDWERPTGVRHRGWKLQEGDRITFSVADSCGMCPECTLHKTRPQRNCKDEADVH